MIKTESPSSEMGLVAMTKRRGAAMATAVVAAVAFVAALAFLGGAARATSLYSEESSPFASMYADRKARQVGDLVTILVTEVSYAQNRSHTNTSQGIGVTAQPGIGIFDFIPAARLDVGDSSKGTSETTRSGRLVGTMTAEVVEVLPNGDLVVRGSREVSVNREKEIMVVEGVVRPQDIGPNNTIPSSMVANAQISFAGGIYTGEKGGVFKTLWDGLVWIWNTIF
ncbi:MAG: flagellar basal body L-ring protein FlgH [Firmicutes bacterium]|nr:flagellar basal body L-ring protein FlgH [Bacillota bacterium]